MISNMIFRAIAVGLGLDPDAVTDAEVEAVMAGHAEVTYQLDGNEQIVATVVAS